MKVNTTSQLPIFNIEEASDERNSVIKRKAQMPVINPRIQELMDQCKFPVGGIKPPFKNNRASQHSIINPKNLKPRSKTPLPRRSARISKFDIIENQKPVTSSKIEITSKETISKEEVKNVSWCTIM